MAEVVGADVVGDGARWQTLISSECRTGVEFARSWEMLQKEGREAAEWLGQDLSGPMAVQVVQAGEGNKDGKTRNKLVEQREGYRAAVLDRALELHPDQQARPFWA